MPTRVGTLPPQEAFYYAVLRHLATCPDGDRREAIQEAIPDLLNLTDAQRHERLDNLTVLRHRHRSGWSLSTLKAAGYIHSPSRGVWRISAAGTALLEQQPAGFSPEVGSDIIRKSRMSQSADPATAGTDGRSDDVAGSSPDERIDAAVNELRSAVATELLDKILNMPPDFFEGLVLDLLHALGYGANRDDIQRVGGSGDGGIDGIITLDRLGFEKVYVQAKRWRDSVGRPEIQAFFGALAARRARRGVFITTSTFTREAREFEGRVAEAVVLIDGERLALLMIDHGVAVTHYRTVRLPRIDQDYF